MARYFFHLHERETALQDLEGQECTSPEEAMRVAVVTARDIMVGEVRAGRLDLSWCISVTDGSAREFGRVAFRDAVVMGAL